MVYKKKVVDNQLIEILKVLKRDIKKSFQNGLERSIDYVELSNKIEEKTGERIDEKTFRNLFADVPENYPTDKVLNPIAKSIDFRDWEHYEHHFYSIKDSSKLFNPLDGRFDVENMTKNQEILVGWYPNNYVKLKYGGKSRFEILDFSDNYNFLKMEKIEIHGFGLEYRPIFTNDNEVVDFEDFASGYPLYPTIRLKSEEEYISNEERNTEILI